MIKLVFSFFSFSAANEALVDRESKVKAVYSDFESDLTLMGATAVEDKLQEDVRGTLIKLGMAGVKVTLTINIVPVEE